jgi:DNA-binding protein YbaB
MFDKMKQLLEVKRQAEILKQQLDETIVETNDVPGIKIKISGAQNFRSVDIDAAYLQAADRLRLQADLLHSLNGAIKKSQAIAAQKMAAVMPNIRS